MTPGRGAMNNGTDGKLRTGRRQAVPMSFMLTPIPKALWLVAALAGLAILLLVAPQGASQGDSPAPAAAPVPRAAQSRYPVALTIPAAPKDPFIPVPAYLVPTHYAATGTTLIRISDQAAFGVGARVLKHDYARRAAWNADGSRLMLVRPHPVRILDASDFAHSETHEAPADALWSATDPDLLYGVADRNVLVRYSVSTRRMDVIKVFEGYSQLDIGGGEGVQSNDDRYVVLIGRRPGGVDVIAYDLVGDRASDNGGRLRFDGFAAPNGDIDWAGISPSGDYIVVKVHREARAEMGFDIYDRRTLAFLRRLLPGSEAHADIGFDQAGHEVLVSMAAGSSAIVSARLADGFVRQELPAAVVSYNNHVSCRNVRRPGWCYVSTYSDPGGRSARLYRGIFSVRLDGSGLVERYAPAFFAQDPVDLAYERQAWAVPSPRGDQVLFGSDWGDASAQAVVHAYVAGVATGTRGSAVAGR